ncbi:pre-toxin TG domain-containing protein, partial [Bacillus pseudomycoides]|uniref:pre-toxin TG domain-containing protein n=1 Tax=Bacillus pseudomycoides TaxID=64104 RepID=UPI002FFD6783
SVEKSKGTTNNKKELNEQISTLKDAKPLTNIKNGWVQENDKWFYYKNNVKTNGWLQLENKWYYLDKIGAMQTGWIYVENKWYYIDESGIMQNGVIKYGGNNFYLSQDGSMSKGWITLNGILKVVYPRANTDHMWSSANDEEVLEVVSQENNGWYKVNFRGKFGFVEPNSTSITDKKVQNYKPAVELMTTLEDTIGSINITPINITPIDIDPIDFDLDLDLTGPIQEKLKNTNQQGWVSLDNKWYYIKNSGLVKRGWLGLNNNWYYFDNYGVMQTNWVSVKGKWFYFNDSGAMQVGWQKISDKWYYMNSSGHMQIGWQNIDDKWYYMNSSGHMQIGWQKIDDKWYYMNSSGHMQIGWQNIDGKRYYMNSSGHMQIGWQKVDDKWYYLNPKTDGSQGVMQNSWIYSDSKWYFLSDSGSMEVNKWITFNNKKFYLNNSGVMEKGWITLTSLLRSVTQKGNNGTEDIYVNVGEELELLGIEVDGSCKVKIRGKTGFVDCKDIAVSGVKVLSFEETMDQWSKDMDQWSKEFSKSMDEYSKYMDQWSKDMDQRSKDMDQWSKKFNFKLDKIFIDMRDLNIRFSESGDFNLKMNEMHAALDRFSVGKPMASYTISLSKFNLDKIDLSPYGISKSRIKNELEKRETLALIIDFTPIIGNIKAGGDVLVGRDLVRGNKLTGVDYVLATASIVAGGEVRAIGKGGVKITNALSEIPTVKVLGRGNSRGRVVAKSLKEQLAMKEVMSNPQGRILTKVPMTDPRWPQEDGWVKMAHNVNGVEIHYAKNLKTGEYDDFKFAVSKE